MIKFPDWVVLPRRQPKERLAAKRLRYMVLRAAIHGTFNGNVASFSEALGMERTTIHQYIKKGRFSESAAYLAERVFGKDLIKAEWLISPLEAPTDD